ncbi:shikimate kinase [Aureimonas endophytica]|uniref:Shikimate kinase n=1 Tax=Aureimonas endophytica TaxID=2027858 RepID=A0A916ZUH4_9HYPH|nr:shikimate kinase [Aureimonas endophytica]GGE13374.1 shikimate kinase [Aureimonas endophytica]
MQSVAPPRAEDITARLGSRSIVLVGLMGAGKSTVGRRLAQRLALPFHDSDTEIETAARMTIAELFSAYGETEFRALEARVVTRLAAEGPKVLATGGGAFIAEATRTALAASSITVWLKADLDILMERVMRRGNRPLLKTADPRATMRDLMERRYPIYALADITILSRQVKREVVAEEIVEALDRNLPAARGAEARA